MRGNKITLLFIFIYIIKVGEIKCDDLKRSAVDTKHIQDLTKRITIYPSNYMPIEEIIKKVNFTNLQNDTIKLQDKFETNEAWSLDDITSSTIERLMKGTVEEIKTIPYKRIFRNLHLINKVDLSLNTKLAIWDVLNREKPMEKMTKKDLKKMKGLLYDVPEHEFLNFNLSDREVVAFLGVSKKLNRRQAGIVGYAMKHKWGKEIVRELKYINKMKGLICGFSVTDLGTISSYVFTKIDQSVFDNVWACTYQQLKILVNKALNPTAFGPLEIWSDDVVRKLGHLVTVLNPDDFERLHSKSFRGLNYDTLDLMSREQLEHFNEEQIINLNENTRTLYKLKVEPKNMERRVVIDVF